MVLNSSNTIIIAFAEFGATVYRFSPMTILVAALLARINRGLVNSVTAAAYHFRLALPVAFTQPGVRLSAETCIGSKAGDPLCS